MHFLITITESREVRCLCGVFIGDREYNTRSCKSFLGASWRTWKEKNRNPNNDNIVYKEEGAETVALEHGFRLFV
jgi:hypothetical protein